MKIYQVNVAVDVNQLDVLLTEQSILYVITLVYLLCSYQNMVSFVS